MHRSKWTHKNAAVAAALARGADSVALLEGPGFLSRTLECRTGPARSPGSQKPWLPLFARSRPCRVTCRWVYTLGSLRPSAFVSSAAAGSPGELMGPGEWGWEHRGRGMRKPWPGGRDLVFLQSAPRRQGEWKGRGMV